jgi:hypothetical protein
LELHVFHFLLFWELHMSLFFSSFFGVAPYSFLANENIGEKNSCLMYVEVVDSSGRCLGMRRARTAPSPTAQSRGWC